MKAMLLWLSCLLACLSPSPSSARHLSADTYDTAIQAAVRKYWGDFPDWLAWKAQLYQESKLETLAVSSVGARGLCQAMPATFADWARDLKWQDANPHVARYCIEGGAYYMAQLRRFWKAIEFPDRQLFAQASYNAGGGNIRKARQRCGGPGTWVLTAVCLPLVTGAVNARQTTDYVDRIAKWRAMLGAK